jgi:hypothetical protein
VSQNATDKTGRLVRFNRETNQTILGVAELQTKEAQIAGEESRPPKFQK